MSHKANTMRAVALGTLAARALSHQQTWYWSHIRNIPSPVSEELNYIQIAWWQTAVSPLLSHWGYRRLESGHRRQPIVICNLFITCNCNSWAGVVVVCKIIYDEMYWSILIIEINIVMLGLHVTPVGLELDLRATNGQSDSSSGVGRQDHTFLLYYSPKGHTLPQILTITRGTHHLIRKLPWPFQPSKMSCNLSISIACDQLAAGSSVGRKFLASKSWYIGASYVIRHGGESVLKIFSYRDIWLITSMA